MVLLLLYINFKLVPMEQLDSRLATLNDTEAVVSLINNHAAREASGLLVIVPEKFRTDYIKSLINHGQLFVALRGETIVGIKKLFIPDEQKVKELLYSELRVNPANQLVKGYFTADNQLHAINSSDTAYHNPTDTYIYTGLDYTHPIYRGMRINYILYTISLKSTRRAIIDSIVKNKSARLHMLYGLVKKNGPNDGTGGRTPSILQAFRRFIATLGVKFNDTDPIEFHSYRAHMPTFDPKSEELIPLPDNNSIEGCGCVLTYTII